MKDKLEVSIDGFNVGKISVGRYNIEQTRYSRG